MAISASDLANARSSVNTLFTQTATVTRNNVLVGTYNCAVTPVLGHQRLVRLGNVQEFLRLQQWQFKFPFDATIEIGDIIAVTGDRSYRVLDVANKGTVSTSSICYAGLDQAEPDILVSHVVGFRQAQVKPPGTLENIGVGISPVSPLEAVNANGVTFTHAVLFDNTLAFPNGQPVSLGDYIVWDQLSQGEAALSYPNRYSDIGVAIAYFKGV